MVWILVVVVMPEKTVSVAIEVIVDLLAATCEQAYENF